MTVPFTIDFTSPNAPANLTISNLELVFDPVGQPSAHSLTWLPIGTAPENLIALEVWTTDAVETRRIALFTDPAVTSFIYYFPRFNLPITYQIFQRVRSGTTTQIGLFANTIATATHRNISIASVINPTAHRVGFEAFSGFSEAMVQTQEWQIPAGGQNYFEIAGSLRGRDMSFTAEFNDRADGSGITALQTKTALETIFDTRPPETCCLRYPRGGGKWFGRFNGNISVGYVYGGVRYTANVSFRRTSFKEGG